MTKSLSHRVPHLALALLAGAAVSAAACAQSAQSQPRKEKEARIKGSLDQPFGAQAGGGAGRAKSHRHLTMNTNDEDGSYTLIIDGDEISAQANGQPVPADRIDREGDTIVIKDEDGNTLKTFNVGIGKDGQYWIGDHFRAMQGSPFAAAGQWWNADEFPGVAAYGQPGDPPPVMVGITMTDADPSLIEDLDIDSAEAFMIDRVIEGLPAAEAGIQPQDVVVRINGKKPASQERFRETLKGKKPGDKIELTIVRKGKERTIPLKLAPYDGSKLGQTWVSGQGGPDTTTQQWQMPFTWNQDQNVSAEARKRIEEALKSLRENPDLQNDKARKHAEEALQQALKSLQDSKDALAKQYYQFRTPQGGGGQDVIVGNRPGQFFRVPAQPQAGQDRDVTRRIERLSDMLERLDKRLDEIEKRLERTGR